MRGFWVGAGVASLLVTGLTAPPVAAAEPAADTTVQAVTPGPNPTISETCGLDATLILDAQWPNARSVAAMVDRARPTVLFTVPSLYRDLLRDDLAAGIAAAGVRLCVSAGESLPPQVRDGWLEQGGPPIANGYGASETLVLVMLSLDGQGFLPSPGVEVRPLDDVPPGVPTRLLIRSRTLALG